MLRAVIFDFDGVIADAEPLHYKTISSVLSEVGVDLSRDDYYARYLAYDDKTCFVEALRSVGLEPEPSLIADLMERKERLFLREAELGDVIFPGVRELLAGLQGRCLIAIGSAARREEIELILGRAGLLEGFDVVVSADEVERCKPNPEVFLKAHEALCRISTHPFERDECVVIEDSPAGIEAALWAGMRCVAVAHTYPAQLLGRADMVVEALAELDTDTLESLCR